MTGISENRRILGQIRLVQGPDSQIANLTSVLQALWKVADARGHVDRTIFEPHMRKLGEHIQELKARGSLTFIYGEFGTEPRSIVMLRRDIPRNAECLMFIDGPNLCNLDSRLPEQRGIRGEYVNFYRTNWVELRQVCAEFTGVPINKLKCRLYMQGLANKNGNYTNRVAELEKNNIGVKTRHNKDTDNMLITDMLLTTISRLEKGRDLYLTLVTGDSDYIYPIEELRKTAERLQMSLHVYVLAWRDACSPLLKDAVDAVSYIDTHLSRIDPEGSRMFLSHSKQRACA